MAVAEHDISTLITQIAGNLTKDIDKLKADLEVLIKALNNTKNFCENIPSSFIRVKVVISILPSEYSHGKMIQERVGISISEQRILRGKFASKLRSLRKKLNEILHMEAYRVYDLWILKHNADLSKIEEFINEAHKEISKLYPRIKRPIVTVVDAYVPRDVLLNGLRQYIEERKNVLEECKNKLKTTRKKRGLYRSLQELQREIESLEEELKYLTQI
jgi:DNA repair exonuclease SbcCD ATPase subunit